MLNEQGRPVFERPYLHDPSRDDFLEVATNQAVDRIYLLSQRGFYNVEAKPAENATYLDELNLHGELLHGYSTVTDNTLPADPRWLTTAQACLLPIAPAAWLHFLHSTALSPWFEEKLSFEQAVALLDAWGWAAMSLLAVGLAAVAFVWVRRREGGAWRAWGWAGFVLAFGPAGLLTLRLAEGWPRRVPCPYCGQRRALNGDECPQCRRG